MISPTRNPPMMVGGWISTPHAEQYGGSPDKMFVAGHSAGAHLAVLHVSVCVWFCRLATSVLGAQLLPLIVCQ